MTNQFKWFVLEEICPNVLSLKETAHASFLNANKGHLYSKMKYKKAFFNIISVIISYYNILYSHSK